MAGGWLKPIPEPALGSFANPMPSHFVKVTSGGRRAAEPRQVLSLQRPVGVR
ncbi:MAG: hypothetical protein K0T01_1647 [Acidimicrobiia bacterium]|nr:hypothetical protein [Acidimicrobiia bacterium]